MSERLKNISNPFSSSRVDSPFQQHFDFEEIYHNEFEILTTALTDVKSDPNQQSKGVVVIGEAGLGKTHLMMRLANEKLKTNRLLFIRQPNNPHAVLYHTYSRILESFVEPIPDTKYNQIDQFLAKSFLAILSTIPKVTQTAKGQEILSALEQHGVKLYLNTNKESTTRFRDNWNYIWRHIAQWWTSTYSTAGQANDILKGIVKFCSYTDSAKKGKIMRWLAANEMTTEELADIGLKSWQDDISREEFALEAISVFGKLSIHDEPLIIVFDQLEGLNQKPELLESFGHAIKEILTYVPNSLTVFNLFPDRWEQFQNIFDDSVVGRMSQYEVVLKRPTDDKLTEMLRLKAQTVDLALEELLAPKELADLLKQRSIRSVLNRAAAYYRAKANNVKLPPSTSLVTGVNVPLEPLQKLSAEIGLLKQALSSFSEVLHPLIEQSDATDHTTVTSTINSSTLDAKVTASKAEVLDYLKRENIELEKAYHKPTILADSDELGKLMTIVEAFKQFANLETEQLSLGKKKLPEHLLIRAQDSTIVLGFLNAEGRSLTARLKNFNQLLIRHKDTHFKLIRDAKEAEITGKVSKEELAKLQNAPNGTFIIMGQSARFSFELTYNLIVNVQNRDLEVDLKDALQVFLSQEENWLVNILNLQHK